jgi:hypothetical protein
VTAFISVIPANEASWENSHQPLHRNAAKFVSVSRPGSMLGGACALTTGRSGFDPFPFLIEVSAYLNSRPQENHMLTFVRVTSPCGT